MSAILMYHSVTEEVEDPYIQIRRDSLVQQLDWIESLGYRWAKLEQVVARPGADLVAITFDDGLEDFATAVEIFERRSIPLTHYICPGLWGGTSSWSSRPRLADRRLLGPAAWRELLTLEWLELGCHGLTHQAFTQLAPLELAKDLDRALDLFREELDLRPSSLAYPYGRFDAENAAIVAERFEYALGVDRQPGVDPRFSWPRVCCREGMGRAELELALGVAALGPRGS